MHLFSAGRYLLALLPADRLASNLHLAQGSKPLNVQRKS